jgi:hypothetical protein
MWLEGDERRLSHMYPGGGDHVPDHVDVTLMHAVEAADSERHGPDRARGESEVD